jgi:hypothetical protein
VPPLIQPQLSTQAKGKSRFSVLQPHRFDQSLDRRELSRLPADHGHRLDSFPIPHQLGPEGRQLFVPAKNPPGARRPEAVAAIEGREPVAGSHHGAAYASRPL